MVARKEISRQTDLAQVELYRSTDPKVSPHMVNHRGKTMRFSSSKWGGGGGVSKGGFSDANPATAQTK